MLLKVGFLGCITQLAGFSAGIYVIYDWNIMEPWTWIFQTFYLMVGSFYYIGTKTDWQYTSIYENEIAKVCKAQSTDGFLDRI